MWKLIEEYPNYEVSMTGEIRSINTNIIKKASESDRGYMKVQLYKNGKVKKVRVHRLVANAFIPNPEDKPEVNHKDFDKKNNHVDNLEWVTSQENRKHAGNDSKPVVQYDLRGNYIIEYESITKAVKSVNGAYINVLNALKGERKTAYGFIWRFK